MPHKRKRTDPKPIWAYKEHELFEGQSLEQRNPRQQSRPPPTTPRPQPQPPPDIQSNGAPNGPPTPMAPPQPFASRELVGFERPITNNPNVYDEISRRVCDFVWACVVENHELRHAVAESPGTQIEIEARWGQIQDLNSKSRLVGMHETECVLRRMEGATRFESTMNIEQHKTMNVFLNKQVALSKNPNAMRAEINYKHTKEVDMFYDLDQNSFSMLPPAMRGMVHSSSQRQRIRVTRDMKTGQIIRKIIKLRVQNLEISSPQTEWDYRIGINLEIEFPGPIEGLTPIIENGKTFESMQRMKDRVSYNWMAAYQVDLTQVHQGPDRKHELELELDAGMVIEAAENIRQGKESNFEPLVAGMMNNLRVLSREVTPQQAR
jgi:hypothetical protein